ncbi:MAG: hypothetical protein ACK5JM_07260 [Rhodoblastus sp.]
MRNLSPCFLTLALPFALALSFALAGAGPAAAERAKKSREKANTTTVAKSPAGVKSTAGARSVARVKSAKRECERANYPGDPVCAWESDGENLPTPSPGAVRHEISDDMELDERTSIGSADPVAMGKPPVQTSNPYPIRKKEPIGGGAALNYKF